MNSNDDTKDTPNDGNPDSDAAKPSGFDSTLPMARKPRDSQDQDVSLDLEIDDVQTRLPYGSEDIADK